MMKSVSPKPPLLDPELKLILVKDSPNPLPSDSPKTELLMPKLIYTSAESQFWEAPTKKEIVDMLTLETKPPSPPVNHTTT